MQKKLAFLKYILFVSLLRVPALSFAIAAVRFIFIRYVLRRRLSVWSGDKSETRWLEYSQSAFNKILIRPLTRSVVPISLASSLLWPKVFDKKLLIIGPRYESDYFLALGYGFSKSHLTLIDHFSYSKLVTVGDGHSIQYPNDYFDVVIASWVLAYSKHQTLFLSEVRRVLKQDTGIAVITGDEDKPPSNVFSSTSVQEQWPIKTDNVVVSWPPIREFDSASPHGIVVIQKSTT